MDDQRDYAEEAYNRHVMHTGDGEIEYCEDEQCPSYVPPTEREGEQELAAERAEYQGRHRAADPENGAQALATEGASHG